MSANELLENLYTILKAASAKCFVVDEKFPSKFYESDPVKIYDSYLTFIEKKVGEDGITIKDDDNLELTTISEKFESHLYKAEKNGFYKLYHDITLICTILIHYYMPGTRSYQMVDKFYRFATELILRECYKLGIQLTTTEDTIEDKLNDEESSEKNELNDAISQDFIKISTFYRLPTTQTYHIKTKDQDLFSSIISKSALDHRPQELPNSNFEINNIIPQTNMFEEAPRLGFVAANGSNIPDPTLPPTEMMTHFLHPNWYALPTTAWLEYGEYSSWAPSFNENAAVLDSTTRGIIWLRKIGYNELIKKTEEELKTDKKEEELETDKKEEEDEKENDDIGKKKDEKENDDIEQKNEEDTSSIEKPAIRLENIFDWKPENYIDQDEIESFKDGTQAELINTTLLKMQKLRKERVHAKIVKPLKEESQLYYKVKRMLKEILVSNQITGLPMNHTRGMPVLQANYNGSIPVVKSHPGRKRKHKK